MCAPAVVMTAALRAQSVRVRHPEGVVHGFLALRTTDGTPLADGDLIQTSQGDRLTARAVFHFENGSVRDETAVFSQKETFRLLSYHLEQKGRSFPQAIDMRIDPGAGHVVVRYTDDDGKPQVADERMELPDNLANGLIPILLKNVRDGELPLTLSMVAATPKPRLVKLRVTAAGRDPFSIGGQRREAVHYVLKVDLGGLTGLVAPLVGRQPPDNHVWILQGDAPAFVKSEFPFFAEGPMWRIELTSPVWPKGSPRD